MRFMESADNISKHRQILDFPGLQRGLDFALLQYQARLSSATSLENSAGNMMKLVGAQEFIQEFKLLAETFQVPKAAALPPNLDHTA